MNKSRPINSSPQHQRSDLRDNELVRRTITSVLLVPTAVTVIVAGGWPLGLAVAALAAGAAYEFDRLANAQGVRPLTLLGCVAAAGAVLLAAALPTIGAAAAWEFGLMLVVLNSAAAAAIWARPVTEHPFASIGITLAGALWSGGNLIFLIWLRSLPLDPLLAGRSLPALSGALLALFPVVLTWVADSAAYVVGRAWGHRKLLPRVSPGKTWEGLGAGLLAGGATGGIYAAIVFDGWLALPLGWPVGLVSGLLVGTVGPLGDLAKSVLKREAGVKDTGHIFPGHGGIIDRFDALFFAVPTIFCVLRIALTWGR